MGFLLQYYGAVSQGGLIPTFPINGLTGYWKFDESIGTTVSVDSVQGITAIANNSLLLGDPNGINNNCIDGIGNTYYSTISEDMVNNLYSGTGLTISFWVYCTDTGTDQTWLDSGGNTGDRAFRIATFQSTDNIRILVGNGSEWIVNNTSLTSVNYDEWMHLVLTFDSTDGWNFYKNGVNVSSGTTAFNIGYSDNGIILENNFNNSGDPDDNYGNSRIDELAFYNRAITASEVSTIYNGGTGRFYTIDINTLLSESVAWYGDLVNSGVQRTTLSNGDAITQWDDQSGNGYHLDGSVGTPTYESASKGIKLNSTTVIGRLTSSPITGQTSTIFSVFKENTVGNSNLNDTYYMWFGDAGSGGYYGIANRPNSNSINVQSPPSAVQRIYNGSQVEQNETAIFSQVNVDNTMANYVLRKDGTVKTASDAGSGTFQTSYQSKIAMGGFINTNFVLNGTSKDITVIETIIFDRLLPTPDIIEVENYLNNKYSVF